MENRNVSTHLRPHILPPLTARGIIDSGQVSHLHANTEKVVKQRIGTPAPNKKRPIPDDLDLNNLNISKGNPLIKVDSCKVDETKTSSTPSEKQLSRVPEGTTESRHSNLNLRLKKKPLLEPLVSISDTGKIHVDLNGNGINSDFSRLSLTPEKIHLPSKYEPLKPIPRKNTNSDGNC